MKTTYLDKGLVEIFIAEHLFFSKDYERALKPNLRLGAKSYALFDLNSALKFTERAEICAENTGDKRMLTTALKQKGLVLESIHRFGEAVEAYEKSLEIDREIGDRAAEAANLHQIGKVYQLTNQFEEALEYYNESLKASREREEEAGERAETESVAEEEIKENAIGLKP
jgi:tetratricopeptide (TPR) repeat protein